MGRRRSHSRSRSRSRSKSRRRSRSPANDYRPKRHRRRTRSRSSSRSSSRDRRRYRSRSRTPRSRSRDRGERYEAMQHQPWGPGAGGAGLAPEELGLAPWRAEGGMALGGQLPPWRNAGERLQPFGSDWPPPDDWAGGRSGDEWHREGSRGRSRGSDTDRDWEMDREVEWSRRFREPELPTASIFIKGLPDDADESDIHRLFEAYPNIQSVKLLRDRQSGRSKGMAFVDFASVDDARGLMESEQRWSLAVGGQRLLLDYSHGTPVNRAGSAGDAGQQALDWICDMCSAVNFARRLECYHCYTARPANPRRVTSDLNEPSNILKISGLEPSTSEEALYNFCAAVVPTIVDLRVIKDKYTGAPRGFAFVELPSIAEAGSLMVSCQGQTLPGQHTSLRICYAKAKDKLLGTATGAAGMFDAAVAAAAGQDGGDGGGSAVGGRSASTPAAAAGWKPKEFDATAVLDEGGSKQQNSQGGGGSSSGTATAQPTQQQQQQQHMQPGQQAADAANSAAGPGPSSEAAAASAAAAAAAGVDAATIEALTQAGFEYQASSGYWYDAKSGYFYDAKTSLYYHHSTNQWYQYNHSTGEYAAVGGEQQQQQQQQQHQGAQETATAQQQQQHQQQFIAQPQPQQQQQQQRQADAADKRRRAVIGSKPQYNPEGLLAAAALAKEKEEEQKRLAAAKAARERQQQQQNKHLQKQQQPPLMPGKPGIGALPGTGAMPAPLPAAQVVADGKVQGVVYKSKWAQQRAAQQQR